MGLLVITGSLAESDETVLSKKIKFSVETLGKKKVALISKIKKNEKIMHMNLM